MKLNFGEKIDLRRSFKRLGAAGVGINLRNEVQREEEDQFSGMGVNLILTVGGSGLRNFPRRQKSRLRYKRDLPNQVLRKKKCIWAANTLL